MFLPFTDLRLCTGEPFKCFPFKFNAYAVFTPKTLPFTPQSEIQRWFVSAHHQKASPVMQQQVLYGRLHKVSVERFVIKDK